MLVYISMSVPITVAMLCMAKSREYCCAWVKPFPVYHIRGSAAVISKSYFNYCVQACTHLRLVYYHGPPLSRSLCYWQNSSNSLPISGPKTFVASYLNCWYNRSKRRSHHYQQSSSLNSKPASVNEMEAASILPLTLILNIYTLASIAKCSPSRSHTMSNKSPYRSIYLNPSVFRWPRSSGFLSATIRILAFVTNL